MAYLKELKVKSILLGTIYKDITSIRIHNNYVTQKLKQFYDVIDIQRYLLATIVTNNKKS